jgi:aminotransferase
VISLGQALPGFGPPPSAIRAVEEALPRVDAHIYSADAGLIGLRHALCDRLARHHQVDVSPDEVIITAGGNQAFMLAAMTVLEPRDDVLMPAPYFVNHEMTIRAIGARPIEVPLREADGFAVRWSELVPHLTRRTRAVVICTPSNPTGAVASRDELARIAQELASRSIALFVDEAYMQFVYEGVFESAAALPMWRDNVIVVGTFSKSFGMTGWRVGYMLAERAVIDQAIKVHDAMIICAPVLSQIGAEAAIRESWPYPLLFREELMVRRRLLSEGLRAIPDLHWTPTAGGFFAFVRVAGCSDSSSLAAHIIEKTHVVTIPGAVFGASGEGYIRLSYGSVAQDDLREAVGRLGEYFRMHRGPSVADS